MYNDKIFFHNLNRLFDAQFRDLNKALNANADLLCFSGCMNLVEFMGGISNGKIGANHSFARARFKEGIKILGPWWGCTIGENVMWDLRCASIHQYVIETVNTKLFCHIGINDKIFLDAEKSPDGLLSTTSEDTRRRMGINIRNLVEALEGARIRLIKDLEIHKDKRDKANEALYALPVLFEPYSS